MTVQYSIVVLISVSYIPQNKIGAELRLSILRLRQFQQSQSNIANFVMSSIETKNTSSKEVTATTTCTTTTSNNASIAKKALLATNFFVETNRMESFVAVYYITYAGWNSVMIGIISVVMNITMIVFQTPAGDFLDKTPYKKLVMATAVLTAAVTTTCVVWTDSFWIVLTAKIIEGCASTIFLPGLMTLLLGLCLTEAEVPAVIAQTEVSNKVGSVFFTLGCGLITYFLYPNITSMFYLLGAGGLLAALSICIIPSAAIDFDRARNLSKPVDKINGIADTKKEHMSQLEVIDISNEQSGSIREVLELIDISNKGYEFKDQDLDDKANTFAMTASSCSSSSSTTEVGTGPVAATEALSPTRYLDLLKDKYIVALAVTTFLYHLANALVTPLVAQYVSIIGDERESMVFVSAIMLVFYFVQGITAQWMVTATTKYDHKKLLIVGFTISIIRGIVLTLLVNYWNNKYALTATEILDGVAAGIFDTMIPIIVGTMTVGSGRFGFVYGFIITMWRLGHGFSVLVGESIVHAMGYDTVFLIQSGIGSIALFVLIVFVRVDDKKTGNAATKREPNTTHNTQDDNNV